MAQGSGSAGGATRALGLGTLLCLLLLAHTADAATYTVGDSGGWTFNMASWTRGKRFRAGDVLGTASLTSLLEDNHMCICMYIYEMSVLRAVFRYSRSVHNVVPVSAAGYNGCSAPRGSRTYNSGNDRITLARGRNYFICSIAGHCQSGMKIAVVAA
ncbi:hypothetical protein ZIOFF_063543 [Zingiber officinale]|uniref:Phytocyanin domain-containing protein n=1 Tax=Zingiber officinale TaxID=94328 RepID=A0A8J5F215_ZINOF|nr:hypothetical protein ZIOFF_063543 [Zingiber officinale]